MVIAVCAIFCLSWHCCVPIIIRRYVQFFVLAFVVFVNGDCDKWITGHTWLVHHMAQNRTKYDSCILFTSDRRAEKLTHVVHGLTSCSFSPFTCQFHHFIFSFFFSCNVISLHGSFHGYNLRTRLIFQPDCDSCVFGNGGI